MKPKISIIIPMWNVEKFLRRCLDSVTNQTFKDWQAICVDDGSPDKSVDIAEEYAKKDKRFIIVRKENGGLSDARNAGMKHVSSEYVMFLDSDDFIHPQTMEIAYGLAKKNGTDIVSWYKDKMYRPQLLVRHKLGLDIDNAMPRGIKKRYTLDKVKYCVTDDIFNNSTEWPHTKQKWVVKHCYVWRHLIKTDFLRDISFIKGIIFEDFPWWSAVMLKRPTVTITKLPFYYYFPNFNSYCLATKEVGKLRNWLIGLKESFILYKDKATDYEMQKWQENYMWPVIIYQIARKLKYVQTADDIKEVQNTFSDLMTLGVFDNPPNKISKKYRDVVYDFIK